MWQSDLGSNTELFSTPRLAGFVGTRVSPVAGPVERRPAARAPHARRAARVCVYTVSNAAARTKDAARAAIATPQRVARCLMGHINAQRIHSKTRERGARTPP